MSRLPKDRTDLADSTDTSSQSWLSIQEAANILSISTKTLRRWEASGKLIPERTKGGHRRYDTATINALKTPKRRKKRIYTKSNLPFTPPLQQPLPQIAPEKFSQPLPQNEPQIPLESPHLQFLEVLPDLYNALQRSQKQALWATAKVFAATLAVVIVVRSGILSTEPLVKGLQSAKPFAQFLNDGARQRIPGFPDVASLLPDKPELVQAPIQPEGLVLALTTENQTFKIFIPTNIKENLVIDGDIEVSGGDLTTSADTFNLLSTNATTVNIGGEATSIAIGADTGTLTLNNSTVAASGDITAAGNADIAGATSVGGDLSVTGTSFIPTLAINADTFTDLTGAGLQITNGTLETTTGTSIESSEISDGTIVEVDLSLTNDPTDDYILSYDAGSGGFTWVADQVGSSGLWSDGGTVTYLTSTSDDVAIGGTGSTAPLFFDVSAGNLTVTGQLITGSTPVTLTTATGFIDADALQLISADGAGGTSSGSGLEVDTDRLGLLQGCAGGEVLKWNDITNLWECASDTGGAAAIINVEENDVAQGVNVDTIDFINVFDLTASPLNEVNIDIADDALDFTELADSLTLDAATDINLIDNTSNIFTISEGGNNYLDIDTNNSAESLTLGNSLTDLDVTLAWGASGNLVLQQGGSPLDCSGLANGGVLTTNLSGEVICQADDGGGAAPTLQTTYDNDIDGSDAIIALTTGDDSLIFRNPAASGTDSGYILWLDQLNTGNVDAFRLTNAGTGEGVQLTLSNTSGTRTNGILIDQTAAGTTTNALSIIETAGTITTGINIGAGLGTGIDLNANTITNIGNSGTDFNASGGLNLAATLSVDGNTIGLNDDASVNNVISFGTGPGQATGSLYWGDDLLCDPTATDCGWATSASSPWTTDTNVVNLTTDTDDVTVGSLTALAKLAVDGDSDEVQLLVQGNATQNASLFVLEQSDTTDVMTVSNSGNLAIEGQLSDISQATLTINDALSVLGSLTVTGVISDSDSNLILDDTVDLGSATTGLNVTTAGILTDIDGAALQLDDDLQFVGAQQITTTTGNLTIDSAGTFVISDATDLNSTLNLGGDLTFDATTPNISINDTETLTITDGTNTLLTLGGWWHGR